MHGRFGPADVHTGADSQVNYIYPLSPSCSRPTFWSSQIMVIIEGYNNKLTQKKQKLQTRYYELLVRTN
jgi:hypothetical protein